MGKQSILGIMIWASTFIVAQQSRIPKCYQEQIAQPDNYMMLSIVEVEGDTLYHLEKEPKKGVDMITVNSFKDKNCKEIKRSIVGGVGGMLKYKKARVIEVLWAREEYPMNDFLKKKVPLTVTDNYYSGDQIKLDRHERILLSAVAGLQKLKKGKVAKSYKFIILKPVFVHNDHFITDPTSLLPANGLMMQYDDSYWMLLAYPGQLKMYRTDKEGAEIKEDGYLYLGYKEK